MVQGSEMHAALCRKSLATVLQHGLVWHLLRHQLLCMLALLRRAVPEVLGKPCTVSTRDLGGVIDPPTSSWSLQHTLCVLVEQQILQLDG